jgi:hypothetical protein
MRPQFVFVLLWFISGGVVSFSGAAEQHMMESRVPRDKLAEAKALVSPFQDSPEILAKGRALVSIVTVKAEQVMAPSLHH